MFYIFNSGFDKDPKKSKFEVSGKTKHLAIVGNYNIDGKVLFLPITGNGFANFTFGMRLILT